MLSNALFTVMLTEPNRKILTIHKIYLLYSIYNICVLLNILYTYVLCYIVDPFMGSHKYVILIQYTRT